MFFFCFHIALGIIIVFLSRAIIKDYDENQNVNENRNDNSVAAMNPTQQTRLIQISNIDSTYIATNDATIKI